MKIENKVAEEVAIEEVKEFAEFHLDKELDLEKVKEDYPDVVLAVQRGMLTFSEGKVPVLKLKDPVKTESGGIALDTITFKTRIVASKQAELAKGIDLKSDSFVYLNRMRGFYISQPVAMLDKLGKFDFKVIDQITSVF